MIGFVKQYLWVFNLVAILLCSYFGAKLTNLYIESKIAIQDAAVTLPQAPPAEAAAKAVLPSSAYEMILQRNIFDSTELPPEEAPDLADETPAVPTGEPVRTGLNIQVMGVMVIGEGKDPRSSATVAGGTGRGAQVDTYAVGDVDGFAPSTKLTQVQPDRIVFLHKGRLEFAPVAEEAGASIFGPPPVGELTAAATPAPPAGEAIRKEEGNRFVIDQREVQNALNNIDRLYTEIRAVPNFAGGKVSGMKILSVKQGSLFDKLGLQRGDILQQINGLELDVKRGFEIFNQLKNETNLVVDVVRQGRKETFEYEIR